jgi:hypothetical protein
LGVPRSAVDPGRRWLRDSGDAVYASRAAIDRVFKILFPFDVITAIPEGDHRVTSGRSVSATVM